MTNRDRLIDFQQGIYEILSKIKGINVKVVQGTEKQGPIVWELSNNMIASGSLVAARHRDSSPASEPIITELSSKNSEAASVNSIENNKEQTIYNFMKSNNRV